MPGGLRSHTAPAHSSARRSATRPSLSLTPCRQGQLLVLDTASVSYSGIMPPTVTSVEDCAAACAALPGCNAYNWCGRAGGCGAGCKAYVKRHPPLQGDTEGLAERDRHLPMVVSCACVTSL